MDFEKKQLNTVTCFTNSQCSIYMAPYKEQVIEHCGSRIGVSIGKIYSFHEKNLLYSIRELNLPSMCSFLFV